MVTINSGIVQMHEQVLQLTIMQVLLPGDCREVNITYNIPLKWIGGGKVIKRIT